VAAFIPLIAAGVSAFAQHKQGEEADQQAQQQAQLDRLEGQAAEQQTLTQESTQRRTAREFLGRQSATLAQSGIGAGTTSEGVQTQSAINAELDALNIRYRGALTKFGYDYNAQSTELEGKAQKKNANLAAGATLLKGASNYYTQNYA